MSFVTTPMRSPSRSSRQSAAMRLLLPEPTGPPTPTRNARSAGKEALRASRVDRCGELDADRRGRLLLVDRPLVGGDRARRRVDLRREVGDPARGVGGIEP